MRFRISLLALAANISVKRIAVLLRGRRPLTSGVSCQSQGHVHKPYIIVGATGAGIVLAIAGLLAAAYHHEFSEAEACKSTLQAVTSPSGLYRAEMKNQICRWGLGLAVNSVSVKVEKLGKDGWFYTIPLEYDGLNGDQGLPIPTINWSDPNSLMILVHTRDTSGTLMRTSHELTVVRSYVGLRGS